MQWIITPVLAIALFAVSTSASAGQDSSIIVESLPANSLAEDSITGVLASKLTPWEDEENPVNRGYTERPYWYRLSVDHLGDGFSVLEVASPVLDRLDFYWVEQGRVIQSFQTGDNREFRTRDIPTRTFAFDVVGATERAEIYLRVETDGSHQVPLRVWDRDEFHEHTEKGGAKRALFYGMLLVIFATNVLLFVATRSRALLLFAFVQLGVLAIISTVQGVAFQYLFPGSPVLNERIMLLSVPFTALMTSAFCRESLSLARKWEAGNNAVRALEVVSSASLILSLLLDYSWAVHVAVITGLFVCVSLLVVGCLSAAKKIPRAGYFSIGWAFFVTGGAMYIMSLTGYFPDHVLLDSSIETGAVITSLLMSFALGRSLHQQKEARLAESLEKIHALEEMRQAKEMLNTKARRHWLTGLPNRDVLDQYLWNYLRTHQPEQWHKLGLLFIDFSNLGEINKTMGHEQADEILTIFVNQLDKALDDSSLGHKIDPMNPLRTLCHVESATFAVTLIGASAEAIERDAMLIVEQSRTPICFRELILDPTSICGLSVYPDYSLSPELLMRHAFIAFDEAEKAIDRFSVYNDEHDDYNQERLTLMGDLREAIQRDELELYYQPQMDLRSGSIYGFEALLRWNHEVRGFVPPDEFIPIAETAGLISSLTQWVVNQACSFIVQMQERGRPTKVAVNISAVNLREKDFSERIIGLLQAHDISPELLCLEVTETAAMNDPERSLLALKDLSDAGIHLSVDDYGTGQSSLQYIKRLPVHEIKIDRSFVMMMHQSAHDETIVRTTIMMCHLLGYRIVAEGVENDEIEGILKTIDCDYAQGYYYSRPVPSAVALDLL